MKRIGGAAAVGIILALMLIYALRPLNTGAVALVTLLCVAFAELAAAGISRLTGGRTDK